ncbi:GntR family transcriptional regulator [Advenella kashmirensis W13003]|uniref:GntR family transcriptional regulator n=1 Tax=Advenella kashmirensis W13003 TaxID=1424334 RepID=V8QWJ4_9BURK|nr:FCD domain-containing protein [Advenella kashmirensis]ETF04007.1 GntR family transcriptional regulator [Advenella kashmirensis W13003]
MVVPSPSARSAILSQTVVSELKRLIYSGEFLPGERLNEATLAVRMGTSRGPIREAMKVLAGLGLVTSVPNRGMFVRQLSVRDMVEVYELRAVVFAFAAERASQNFSRQDAAQFEQLLSDMDAACEADDGTLYYELNLAFHELILDLSGNKRAKQAYDDYVKELHLFRRKYFNVSKNMHTSNVEHRKIYEAIASGSPAKAWTAAQRHVLGGRSRLLATLETPLGG